MHAGIDDGAEVDVIVMYRKKSSKPSYSVSYSTLNTLGARVKYNYKIIDATALQIPAGNLNDLAEVPGVEMVYLDDRGDIMFWDHVSVQPVLRDLHTGDNGYHLLLAWPET